MTAHAKHENAPISVLMLIDDSEFDQKMHQRIINRSGKVETLLQFTDAQEALTYLRSGSAPQPDLILLDINMPSMNGFQFLEKATAEIGAALCPVIVMLTTSLNPGDEERARAFQIVKDFFSKPLTELMLDDLSGLLRLSENHMETRI